MHAVQQDHDLKMKDIEIIDKVSVIRGIVVIKSNKILHAVVGNSPSLKRKKIKNQKLKNRVSVAHKRKRVGIACIKLKLSHGFIWTVQHVEVDRNEVRHAEIDGRSELQFTYIL